MTSPAWKGLFTRYLPHSQRKVDRVLASAKSYSISFLARSAAGSASSAVSSSCLWLYRADRQIDAPPKRCMSVRPSVRPTEATSGGRAGENLLLLSSCLVQPTACPRLSIPTHFYLFLVSFSPPRAPISDTLYVLVTTHVRIAIRVCGIWYEGEREPGREIVVVVCLRLASVRLSVCLCAVWAIGRSADRPTDRLALKA